MTNTKALGTLVLVIVFLVLGREASFLGELLGFFSEHSIYFGVYRDIQAARRGKDVLCTDPDYRGLVSTLSTVIDDPDNQEELWTSIRKEASLTEQAMFVAEYLSTFVDEAGLLSAWDARDRMYDGCGPFAVDSSITLEINPSIGFMVGDKVRLKLEFADHSLLTLGQTRLSES